MALLEVHWNGTFPRTYILSQCEHNIHHSLAVASKTCHNANQDRYMRVVKGKCRSGKCFLPRWQSLEEISKQVAIKGKYAVCLLHSRERSAEHPALYCALAASLRAALPSLWRPLGNITSTEHQGGLITIPMVSWAASWDLVHVPSTIWKSSPEAENRNALSHHVAF